MPKEKQSAHSHAADLQSATVNVVLIWPEFPVTYWGGQYSLWIIGKRALMPPLGLLTVAALCPPEWNLRLIDLNIEKLSLADLDWADLALISGMRIQHKSMAETIERCRESGVPTVVGGPHASSSRERFAQATHLVLDEGEITLPMFFTDYAAGTARRVYESNGEKPELTQTPIPRFDLLKLDAYVHMCIQFSRGCPFNCEFCDITMLFGKTPRTKSISQILAELQAIYDVGFRGEIFFVDDNFVGNKKNVKLMLPELIAWMKERKYPFAFYTEASLTLADDDELLELMREANFYSVFVGIESPSLECLRETQKHQNVQGDMLSKIHKIHSYGMEVMGGFIVGFDQDPEDIFERQLEFIAAARIPMAMVGPLSAMPNTQLWLRLQVEGRLMEEWGGDTFDFCNFVTVMPRLTLIRGYRTIMATLYKPVNFFDRLYDLVSSLQGTSNQIFGQLSPSTRVKYFFPLMGALLWIACTDKNRGEYLRFLMRILRNHPEKFLLALCRTIVGHHLIQYTDQVTLPNLNRLESELLQNEHVAETVLR